MISFTFEYTLPHGEYTAFAVYGEDNGELLYFTGGDSLSILAEANGRFVLAGEISREDTSIGTTSENTGPSDTEDIPVSGTNDVTPKNHVLTVLIIVAIILIVIIAAFVYAYVFKQYY